MYPSTVLNFDTHKHVFWDCRILGTIIKTYFENFIHTPDYNVKNLIFKGHLDTISSHESFFMNIEVILVLYFIFYFRKNVKYLNLSGLKLFTAQISKSLCLSSPRYRKSCSWLEKNCDGNFKEKFKIMTTFPA